MTLPDLPAAVVVVPSELRIELTDCVAPEPPKREVSGPVRLVFPAAVEEPSEAPSPVERDRPALVERVPLFMLDEAELPLLADEPMLDDDDDLAELVDVLAERSEPMPADFDCELLWFEAELPLGDELLIDELEALLADADAADEDLLDEVLVDALRSEPMPPDELLLPALDDAEDDDLLDEEELLLLPLDELPFDPPAAM